MDAAGITAIKVIKTVMLHQFFQMVLLDYIILYPIIMILILITYFSSYR
jgi:hypothetical protein